MADGPGPEVGAAGSRWEGPDGPGGSVRAREGLAERGVRPRPTAQRLAARRNCQVVSGMKSTSTTTDQISV